jgi:hypothetical protein
MSEIYIEIEELLMDEMPVEKIAEQVGVPMAWVLDLKYTLISEAKFNAISESTAVIG